MAKEPVLHKVRTALGRGMGGPIPPPPPPLMKVPAASIEERLDWFCSAFEKLNGKPYRASSFEDAREYTERVIAGRSAVASNSPFLDECGVARLAGVERGGGDRLRMRELCATAAVGISSADYALADTGSLVMISSHDEARLVSLLPPTHVAIVPKQRLLTSLDELLTLVPRPADRSSSMVLITGPSRTADIEQILVRGVHGPGEIHVVLV